MGKPGRIALTKDLIFGLCVIEEGGWIPLSDLDDDALDLVWRSSGPCARHAFYG